MEYSWGVMLSQAHLENYLPHIQALRYTEGHATQVREDPATAQAEGPGIDHMMLDFGVC